MNKEATNEIFYGRNAVLEVIESNKLAMNKIYLSKNFNDKNIKKRILSFSKENKIPFYIVPNEKLNNLTKGKNHQGVVFTISPVQYKSLDEVIKLALKSNVAKIILIAHEIEDNHNLGAMIRTFIALRGKGIILTGRSNVGINATTVKTSAGTVFQADIARATNCVNVLNKLKENGFWIIGTDNSLKADDLYNVDFPEQVAIVVGNEHTGLGELVKKNCDFLVRIPITSSVDSLNVSVAFGIVLFEVLRQKLGNRSQDFVS